MPSSPLSHPPLFLLPLSNLHQKQPPSTLPPSLPQGSLKLLPFSPSGKAQEPFSVRVEESNLLSITFLHGTLKPTLAVLYADHRQARHVKTYTLSPRERDVTAGPWVQMNVERGANLLIPVPGG